MNILVLGSGGREHALAWKIRQSAQCSDLYIAPGNAGTAEVGSNISILPTEFDKVAAFCIKNQVELIVVGPEDPLVQGIYDHFSNDPVLKSIQVVGPSAQGAQLEGSKAFSKHFMQRHNIPTASYAEFTLDNFDEGVQYINGHSMPVVLKADGLAAGKGVVIAASKDEAITTFTSMIKDRQFGDASSRVVIEQFLDGIEVSVFVLTDGHNYKILGHAKDYKRIGEGDTGPNTGGMGCVSPVPFVDDIFLQKIEEKIIQPTISGIQKEGICYEGFIFFGLIKVGDEPFVIEYNCRMGDPETEVVLPRLQNDLVELLLSVKNGNLESQQTSFDSRACCTVMAVSGGYPGDYTKNKVITGLDAPITTGSLVFHAATLKKENNILTNGGRVLTVSSFGKDIAEAKQKSMKTLSHIDFDGIYYRKDIGFEFIKE